MGSLLKFGKVQQKKKEEKKKTVKKGDIKEEKSYF